MTFFEEAAARSITVAPAVNTVTAADIAGVSVRTIYRWMRTGRVEYVKTPTRGVRIFVRTLFREPGEDE